MLSFCETYNIVRAFEQLPDGGSFFAAARSGVACHEVLLALVRACGPPADLAACFWSYGPEAVNAMAVAQTNRILGNTTFVVSSHYKRMQDSRGFFTRDRWHADSRVVVYQVHGKAVAIRGQRACCSLVTSANLQINKFVETYAVARGEEDYLSAVAVIEAMADAGEPWRTGLQTRNVPMTVGVHPAVATKRRLAKESQSLPSCSFPRWKS